MTTRDPAGQPGMRAPAHRRPPRRDRAEPDLAPGVAEVRIIGDPATVAAVRALLAGKLGPHWHPAGTRPSYRDDSRLRLYGSIIVVLPARPEPS